VPKGRKSQRPATKKAAPARAPKPAAPKRTRNDSRKVATRQRLIDATIDIIRTEGVGALTTGKIANAAGIQQPGFYAHFKNVDECLRAAADQLSASMLDAEVKMRRERSFQVGSRERLPEGIARMKFALNLWLDNRRFTELLMRCRYDDSPLGESGREVFRRARELLTEDLLELAVKNGISTRYLREIELMAALLIASFSNGIELVLTGEARDVDAVATALARANYHYVRGELIRMHREQHGTEAGSLPPRAS
jgi:AcrR family transcriptional regulator